MNVNDETELDKIEDKTDDAFPKDKPALASMITSHKFKNLADLLVNIDSVDDLLKYLESELPYYDTCENSLHEKFKKHQIDGYAFQNIQDEHLQDMKITIKKKNPDTNEIESIPLALGPRLRLLSKTQKVKRAVRFHQRKKVIMQGECFVSPPGFRGKYELTHSYLKFSYEKEYHTPFKERGTVGYCCFSKTKYVSKTSTARFLDHIDITLVDDVDVKENEFTSVITQPTCCWGYCCKSTPVTKTDKKNIVYISLNVKSDIGMFIAGADDKETSVLAMHIDNLEEAEMFQSTLLDLMNETQYQEGRSGGFNH